MRPMGHCGDQGACSEGAFLSAMGGQESRHALVAGMQFLRKALALLRASISMYLERGDVLIFWKKAPRGKTI